MNEPSRRDKIEAMLADDPTDQFLRFALAMEQRKADEVDECVAGFRSLMADDAPYVAAFFMSAQVLAEEDRVEEARTALRAGIEEARKQGDSHAAGEMSEYLMSLGSM